ncbi:MAG: DUF1579 domain-containing protein [Phycisphaerae bacterium]
MRKVIGVVAIGVCAAIAAVPLLADDKKPQQPGGDAMKAMMEAWAKQAAPGEHHAHLKPLAGKWESVGKFRMAPEAPWQESNSTSTAEWILGGRFLSQKISGEAMEGMTYAFEGFGVLGYDNLKQKYVSIWMDNMATMIMSAEGTCDSSGRVITFESAEFENPMTGQKESMKSIYRIESNSKYILEMYQPAPDGSEFMSMVIVSTRAS